MKGKELLAFTLMLSWFMLTIGIQIGIRHGRYLQKIDDARMVESSVLDEYLLQLPSDAVRQKRGNCAVLAQALLATGWTPVLIPTMVAISRAEAGCNPLARLRTMKEDSAGALQLNLRVHGQWISEWCATDNVCAARAALKVFQQQGFNAWTSYRTGAWRKFVPSLSGTSEPSPPDRARSDTCSPFVLRHDGHVEPDVGRVAHGVPARVDRLRALGNAVVPQVAEWVGRQILEAVRE